MLLSDGSGIVLHSRFLAMTASLAPQFLLWVDMPQYVKAWISLQLLNCRCSAKPHGMFVWCASFGFHIIF
jgi:hypothetical protein